MKTFAITVPTLLAVGMAVNQDVQAGQGHGENCPSKAVTAQFNTMHPHGVVAIQTENGIVFIDTRDGSIIKPDTEPVNRATPASGKKLI